MAAPSASPCIVWFRDDLRLSDHPALHAAAETGKPVICLYVLDEVSEALRAPASRPLGGAARWWLAQSLRALQERLAALGASLVLRKGPAARIIAELARETGAGAVFWNEIAQAPHRAVADQVGATLQGDRRRCAKLSGRPAGGPRLRPQQGRPGAAGVHAVLATGAGPGRSARAAAGAEDAASGCRASQSDTIESWGLEPTHPDWAGGLREHLDAGRGIRRNSGSRNFLQQA